MQLLTSLGKVPYWVIEEAAQSIACDMCHRVSFCGWRFDEVPDIESLARSYGARVDSYEAIGGEPGGYCLDTLTVAYNRARTPLRQCVTILHETVHHIVWMWVPARLRSGADSLRYDDHFLEVQHEIAYVTQGIIWTPLYPNMPVWHPERKVVLPWDEDTHPTQFSTHTTNLNSIWR